MASAARTRWALVAAAAGVVVLAVVAVVWFFGGSTPAEVDLAELADGSDDAQAENDATDDDTGDEAAAEAGDPDGSSEPASEPEGWDGPWVVDTEAVVFDADAGRGSFVGYRVDEELSTIGSTTAVGRTPAVDGEVVVADGQVVDAQIVADLTQLTSDEGRRDQRLRSTLSADSEARFVLTEPFELMDLGADGEVVEMAAAGELTIEGVTQPVEVMVQALRVDDRVVLAGSSPITLSDFGVEAPSAPIVLSVSDDAVIEWQLYLERRD